MRLKKLLEEKAENEEAQKLYNQLYDYLLTDEKIYRGMRTDVDTFTHRTVRKGRVPNATSKTADVFVNTLLSNLFPDHPERRKSTFGTPSKHFATSFGTTVNLIVPKKGAKVKFYESDTWPRYTSNIGNEINAGTRKLNNLNVSMERETLGRKFEKLREEHDKEIVDFIYGVWEMKSYGDSGIFEDVINQFSKLSTLYGDLKSFFATQNAEEKIEEEIIFAAKKYLHALNTFKKYVSNGHDKYHENTREVIVEGDHLVINPDWFDEHFIWSNGNIQIKSKTNRSKGVVNR